MNTILRESTPTARKKNIIVKNMTFLEMNKKSFGLSIKMLTANFGLKLDSKNKEDKAQVKLIFDLLKLKGFTDQDFKKAVIGIIENETNLFGKLPTVAMFLQYASKQTLNLEQQASIQAERIIEAADHLTTTLFDNEFTNAATIAYGGLKKINYDFHDKFNPNPKKREWLKKELVDIWLTCKADNKRRNVPFIIDGNTAQVTFVGDQVTCQKMMIDSQKQLEAPVAANKAIKNIGNRTTGKKFDIEKARRMLEEVFSKYKSM